MNQTDLGLNLSTSVRGQGGASVSRDQAPVRSHQGALPRAKQEHRATDHIVCAVQPVDGARLHCGSWGMSAPANRGNAQVGRKTQPMRTEKIESGRDWAGNSTIRKLMDWYST